MTDEPEIKCLNDAAWPVSMFKPNPRNPQVHPLEQLELIGAVIKVAGWRSPIIVSKRSGLIVRGHGRLAAAKLAGFKTCPMQYQDYESDEQEIADMLADNAIAELSERDDMALVSQLREISTAGLDTLAAGFSADAFEKLAKDASAAADGSRRNVGTQIIQYNVIFNDELQQQQWYGLIKSLKVRYPTIPTPGARLCAFMAESMAR